MTTPHARRYASHQAGDWLVAKARAQAEQQGPHQAALNLRRQGAPLTLALLIIVGRV